MNKKGLSTIVATLLIILLTVVAVTTVWQILKPMLSNTANQIGAKCITTEIAIKGCTINNVSGTGSVTVMANKGSPDNIRVIYYNKATGVSYNATTDKSALSQFSSKTIPISGLDIKADSVNVAGIYVTGTNEEVCPLAQEAAYPCDVLAA